MRLPASVLLAIAVAASLSLSALAAEPFGFSDQDRADVNCLAASSIALGNAAANGAPDSAEAVGITTVLTYFLGKLKGRHADLRVADVLTPAVYQALTPILVTEAQRCGANAEKAVRQTSLLFPLRTSAALRLSVKVVFMVVHGFHRKPFLNECGGPSRPDGAKVASS